MTEAEMTRLFFLAVLILGAMLALSSCPGQPSDGDGGVGVNTGNGARPDGGGQVNGPGMPTQKEPVPLDKFLPRQDYWRPEGVDWLPFNKTLFEKAITDGKLIFLFEGESITTATEKYAEKVVGDEGFKELIESSYLPCWVDRDRYPGLFERYQAYKSIVPAALVVHPSGPQVLGRTAGDPDKVYDWINYIQDEWASDSRKYDAIAEMALTGFKDQISSLASDFANKVGSEIPEDAYDKVLQSFIRTWDGRQKDMGSGMLFSRLDVIELLNDAALRNSKKAESICGELLDAITEKQIDPAEGGFYSYIGPEGDDYTDYMKRLDANAHMATELSRHYLITGDERYKDAAISTLGFMIDTLGRKVDGRLVAFANFQNGEEEYFAASGDERKGLSKPKIDPTIIAQYNFMAIEALIWAHFTLDPKAGYLEMAVDVADHMIAYLLDDDVFARYADDPLPELRFSADQVWAGRALIELYKVTGINRYEEVARGAQDALYTRFQAPRGGMIDSELNGPGLYSIPFWPMGDASIAARTEVMLYQLSKVTGVEDAGKKHLERAKRCLSIFADHYLPETGVLSQSAQYALASREVISEPLDFHLLFDNAPPGEAANAIAEAFTAKFPFISMEILTIGDDDERIKELGYTTMNPVWVYLCQGPQCVPVAPGEVAEKVDYLKRLLIESGLVYTDESEGEEAADGVSEDGAGDSGEDSA